MKPPKPTERRAIWSFLLVFVLLAAGIVTAGCCYYRNFEQHYRTEVESRISAIANMKAGMLVQWRKERQLDAGLFFKNPSFTALVRHFLEKPADTDAQRQLLDWLGKYPAHDNYDQVRLLDAQGVSRLNLPAGQVPAGSAIVRGASEVLRSGQVALQDFYRDEHDQRIYLAVLVPLLDEQESSQPLGVLVLRGNPETYLYPFLKHWPTPSRTAETLLIRREGNEVLFLNELRFQTNTALRLREPLDRVELPVAQAALGQEGVMEGIDYRGVPVVAALRTIPDSPWALSARMDTAEVYAPIRERLWQVIVLIGALLLGAGACVGLGWRQQRIRFYRESLERENGSRRLATVVRDSNDAITIQDFQGRITAWNRGAELMYGYGEAEALAMNIERLTAPGKVAEQKDFIRRLEAGEAVTSLETQRLTKDGRILDVWMTVTKLMDEAGKPIGLASTERDITARKRAEEEASRMATVVRDSNDAITIQDFQGRITAWNRGAELMYGYGEAEALQMNIERLTAPGKVAEQKDFIRRLEAGEAVTSLETQRLTKDGRMLDVWMTVTKLMDQAGKPIGLASTERDITARKRAEEEASRMATVVRDSNDAITIQDFHGRITAWNRGAELMYGYGEAEALAMNIERLTAPGKVAEQKDFIRRLEAGEAVTSLETQRVTKDERILDVWMTVTKLVDEAGKPIGIASTERDITERNRVAEEASRMATVVRDSNDAITIQDFQGRITAWNRGAELMYGYGEAEALSMNIERLTAPGKVAEQKDFIRRLEAGEAVTSLETQRLTKDGRMLDVWMTVTKLMDQAGKPIGLASTERDMTERKREAEEASRMATVVRDSNDAVTIQDFAGRITAWNRGAELMYGYDEAEALAMNIERLTAPGKVAEQKDFTRRLEAGEAITSLETQRLTKDGRTLDVWMTVTKLVDEAGKPIGIASTERNITERKREAEKLQQQTDELRAGNEELTRFNRAAVGRELQMVKLKQQTNELCREMGKPLMHRLDFLNEASPASMAAASARPKGESET
jgi:PAS domain S-box-containing protein